jgi:hypothetical protein
LRVVADDSGVTINASIKMLGTASAFCHETCGRKPVGPTERRPIIARWR